MWLLHSKYSPGFRGFSGFAVAAIPASEAREAGSVGELQPKELRGTHPPQARLEAGDTRATCPQATIAGGQPPLAPIAAVGDVLCHAPRGR
eukprot:scaffold119032_cov69-Phaeocystis_antarctica.AAC.1